MKNLKKLLLLLMFIPIQFNTLYAYEGSYNIFIQFEENINSFVHNISKQLGHVGLKSFYDQGKKVHLTLYLTAFKQDKFNLLKKELKEISKTTEAFEIGIEQLMITKGDWLFISMEKSLTLDNLARRVVQNLHPLRNKDLKMPDWVWNYPNKVKTFEQYGDPNAYDEFNPHITLLAQSDHKKLTKFMDSTPDWIGDLEWGPRKVISIGISMADQDGQFSEIIEEFPLQ